jgi:hydrogenase expression/formation protein HypE
MSDDVVRLAHGAGGPAMRDLVARVFLGGASHPEARRLDDGAVIPFGGRFLVVSCDAHVVQPRVFPGGDLGRLAVCGTVNDLAVMGATEVLGLTTTFVLEEGFPLAELAAVRRSMEAAAAEAGAPLLAGDVKVMRRGEVDGLVTSTSGVGVTDRVIRSDGLRPGDVVVVSGTLGDHGLCVLAARHDLRLQGDLRSDVAPMNGLVTAALAVGGVRAMKDPTRGGLTAALVELAAASGVSVRLEEALLPMTAAARAAAELLGIDPLVVANEGKVVFGVEPGAVDAVLQALRAHPYGRDAARIGRVVAGNGEVVLDTGFGTRRLREPDVDPLPRIC